MKDLSPQDIASTNPTEVDTSKRNTETITFRLDKTIILSLLSTSITNITPAMASNKGGGSVSQE